jgi:hypothetical protein
MLMFMMLMLMLMLMLTLIDDAAADDADDAGT